MLTDIRALADHFLIALPNINSQLPPHNLTDTFDMVGDQPVYKTPSANVAVRLHPTILGYAP